MELLADILIVIFVFLPFTGFGLPVFTGGEDNDLGDEYKDLTTPWGVWNADWCGSKPIHDTTSVSQFMSTTPGTGVFGLLFTLSLSEFITKGTFVNSLTPKKYMNILQIGTLCNLIIFVCFPWIPYTDEIVEYDEDLNYDKDSDSDSGDYNSLNRRVMIVTLIHFITSVSFCICISAFIAFEIGQNMRYPIFAKFGPKFYERSLILLLVTTMTCLVSESFLRGQHKTIPILRHSFWISEIMLITLFAIWPRFIMTNKVEQLENDGIDLDMILPSDHAEKIQEVSKIRPLMSSIVFTSYLGLAPLWGQLNIFNSFSFRCDENLSLQARWNQTPLNNWNDVSNKSIGTVMSTLPGNGIFGILLALTLTYRHRPSNTTKSRCVLNNFIVILAMASVATLNNTWINLLILHICLLSMLDLFNEFKGQQNISSQYKRTIPTLTVTFFLSVILQVLKFNNIWVLQVVCFTLATISPHIMKHENQKIKEARETNTNMHALDPL